MKTTSAAMEIAASRRIRVAIAEHHLGRVPKGVVVLIAEMYGGVQRQPAVIDRVAAENFLKEIEGRAKPIVCFIHGYVLDLDLALGAHQCSG